MMRGLLLLLAGATLIYLGFNSPDADESTAVQGDPSYEVWQDPVEVPFEGMTEPMGTAASIDTEALSPEQAVAPDPTPSPTDPAMGNALVAEPQQVPEISVDLGPRFELVGVSADPVQLAALLLEAWITRNPVDLGGYVNGEEGGALTPARRELVAAFWQAMVGKSGAALKTLKAYAQDASFGTEAVGVTSGELALLRLAAQPSNERQLGAPRAQRGALERAMHMILLEEDSANSLANGRLPRAAVGYSDLIHAELEAPWAVHREVLRDWADSLRTSQESHRLSKTGVWPSLELVVRGGETLTHIRRRALREQPEILVCTGLIKRVNEVKRYIHPNDSLRVPVDRPNVLVDLSARLVVYRHGEEAVLCFPCGIGREGKDTPPGIFAVGDKVEEPIWYQSDGPPVPFGSPENALGDRWIEWRQDGQKTSYGFHGTNDPNGVGSRVSRGCIRLRNEDVRELFELLPVGAEIVIQP